MRIIPRLCVALLPVLLCGCPDTARNIRSVKAPDYAKAPRHMLVVIANPTPLLDEFRRVFAADLAGCGASVQFSPLRDPPGGAFDAVMTATSLGIEQTTLSGGSTYARYLSAARYEFALTDTETQRNVWKEQIDFTNDLQTEATRQTDWANALFDSLKKSALVGDCDPAHAVPVAAQLTILPPPPTVGRYSIGGKIFPTAEAGLAVAKQLADLRVAKLPRVKSPTYPSLLMVMPSPADIDPAWVSRLENRNDFAKFLVAALDIEADSFVDAYRKLALFETIDRVRSDEVSPGDFRGHAYRIWFVPGRAEGEGSWMLASAQGGERRFAFPVEDHTVSPGKMLMSTSGALKELAR